MARGDAGEGRAATITLGTLRLDLDPNVAAQAGKGEGFSLARSGRGKGASRPQVQACADRGKAIKQVSK
jgi:hypothetical protein